MNSVTVGLIQMKAAPAPEENLARASAKVREAARRGAQVIALPELFGFRYFPQRKERKHFKLAEEIPGPITKSFGRIARKHRAVIVLPVFERTRGGRFFNSAAVIDTDGAIAGVYRKIHLPNDPCFYEKFYFSPGNLGFKAVQTRFGKIGALICWDQWFPEAARASALAGAEILIYPSAIGWLAGETAEERRKQISAWEVIQRAHAIANGIFAAAVNRVGREGRVQFWGSSFAAGPFGEALARAGETQEEIVIAKCNLTEIKRIRKDWPFLKERKVNAYQMRSVT